jgi:hypothetical protein
MITLFRFAQYCKLCGGLPYLWKTLAYPVNEIALLGNREKATTSDRSSISLIEVQSLEVDRGMLFN